MGYASGVMCGSDHLASSIIMVTVTLSTGARVSVSVCLCACVYVLSGKFCHVFAWGEKTPGHVEVSIYPPVHCHPSCLAQ